MSTFDFVCEPLNKHHDRMAFRCSSDELNRYLHERAGQDARRRVAAVFVMVPAHNHSQIAGYYTLAAGSVRLAQLPEALIKKLPRYPNVPAVVLGRLARNVRFPGLGQLLLLDALNRAYRHSDEVAAALVIVDAKDDTAKRFYEKFGFCAIADKDRRLFLAMQTIAQL